MLKRFLFFALALVLVGIRNSRAGDAPAADWPAFHAGGALTGAAAADPGPPPMKTRWTYRTGEEHPAAVTGSSAIVGDTVYVADSDGVLHAIDLKSGKARW